MVSGVVGVAAVVYLAAPLLIRVADRMQSTAAPGTNLALLAVSPLVAVAWAYLVFTRKHLAALGLLVLLLPATGRVADVAGITANVQPPFGANQVISATTALAIGLLFAVVLLPPLEGPPRRRIRWFALALGLFAAFGTAAQLVHHPAPNALVLSLGAFWQYLALFAVVVLVVRTRDDATFICRALVLSLLLGVAVRILSTGQFFFVETESGGVMRLGGAGFGPAIYYGGSLAVGVALALYLLRVAKSPLTVALWALATAVLFLELLGTGTRGAIVALIVSCVAHITRSNWRFAAVLVVILMATLPVTGDLYDRVFSQGRELPLNASIMNVPHAKDRLELLSVNLPLFFDNYGLGYGIGQTQYFEVRGRMLTPHNVFLGLSQEAGGLAAVAFVGGLAIAAVRLWRAYRGGDPHVRLLSTHLAMALIAWLAHANTSTTIITWYVPYEATMLFYLPLFLAVLAPGLRSDTRLPKDDAGLSSRQEPATSHSGRRRRRQETMQ